MKVQNIIGIYTNYNSSAINRKKHNVTSPVFKAGTPIMLNSFDKAIINKLRIPIDKFKDLETLKSWSMYMLQQLLYKDDETKMANFVIRKMKSDWQFFAIDAIKKYSPLLMLFVFANLKQENYKDENKELLILDENVFDNTYKQIESYVNRNNAIPDFITIYKKEFNKAYKTQKEEQHNYKWIIVPSKQQDPNNFESNIEKLQKLSHKSWCTKSTHAESFLEQGEFHILQVDGEPKVGMRFSSSGIKEIQGELNNSEIPFRYVDEIKEHVKMNGYNFSSNEIAEQMRKAEDEKEIYKVLKPYLQILFKKNEIEDIFNILGLTYIKKAKGDLLLDYHQPKYASFKDLGLDEDFLLKNVAKIELSADFTNSEITKLPKLETIGGKANFKKTKISDLSSLKQIGEVADFRDTMNLKSMPLLESVGDDFYIQRSQLETLPSLRNVDGSVYIKDSNLTSKKFENVVISGRVVE